MRPHPINGARLGPEQPKESQTGTAALRDPEPKDLPEKSGIGNGRHPKLAGMSYLIARFKTDGIPPKLEHLLKIISAMIRSI